MVAFQTHRYVVTHKKPEAGSLVADLRPVLKTLRNLQSLTFAGQDVPKNIFSDRIRQGDQIGPTFVHWAIVYFGNFQNNSFVL
jgi:hypothetical protein